MRALHLFWWQTLQAPEQMLDDLARHTDINTLILDASYMPVDDPDEVTVLARVYGSQYVLPSTVPFGALPISVVDEADYAAALGFMDLARSRGFSISCHVLPLNPNTQDMADTACRDIASHPVLDEDVTGGRELGGAKYAHACPNNPEVQHFGEGLVRGAIAAWPGLEMLDLNHLEYPHWPRTGLAELFVCFCDFCAAAARAQGIDFEAMKREVAWLHAALGTPGERRRAGLSANDVATVFLRRPQLAVWLNFRLASMSAYIERLAAAAREAAAAHNPDLKLGIDVHLPAICALVGTDLELCGGRFDWVSPKFPDYMPGSVIPLTAAAVAAAGRYDEADLRQTMRDLCDLGPGPAAYVATAMDEAGAVLYPNAYDPAIIARQMPHLAGLKGTMPLYAWTWLDNRDTDGWRRKFDVLRENDLDGYFLWCWESDLTPKALAESRGIF